MNQLPPMTLLDYKVSSKELNMLKVMLPFVDIHFQPMLATYIKYSELRATMDLFSHDPYVFGSSSKSPDFSDIISAILPYLSDEERESMENMQNIINTMNMFEMYKDVFTPDMMSGLGGFDETVHPESDVDNNTTDFSSILQQLSGLM